MDLLIASGKNPAMSIRPSGYLSSSGDRKMIASAIVRWVEGKECGVKLERMEPESAAQLSEFSAYSRRA